MEIDNKVSSDLYRATGESFMQKNVSTKTDQFNPSAMMFKLNHVRNLTELSDTKISNLLRATDEL